LARHGVRDNILARSIVERLLERDGAATEQDVLRCCEAIASGVPVARATNLAYFRDAVLEVGSGEALHHYAHSSTH
jgi:hypothetical protein